MTPHDRTANVSDLLAMQQASVARILATAKALHDQGELRPMPSLLTSRRLWSSLFK